MVCALVPRFSLIAACEDRRELLREPAAVAPAPGAEQRVGEVSGSAEAHGVRAGMRLGEALSRCPMLVLLPPDPGAADRLWEAVLTRLEGIGAGVESDRPGEAFFRADGLRAIHGGTAGTLGAAARAARLPVRLAAAPTRFAAYAAALEAGARTAPGGSVRRGSGGSVRRGLCAPVVPSGSLREFLAPLGVGTLAGRLGPGERDERRLLGDLERLGIGTLGAFAELPAASVADRFGPLGTRALRLARGEDDPPRPRPRPEALSETLELPEEVAGGQLERALALLVDRLLASPDRRGRTVRALDLGASLAGGGSWSAGLALRSPSASPVVLGLALAPKLAALPGPASALTLRVRSLGPPASTQEELAGCGDDRRRRRLGEAVRQARAAAGPDALLRALVVDGASRVPERRAMLTPFPDS
ncbi:MAG: hypothetical protein U0R52_13880 [Solirubrobacterales bacterium]